MKQNRILKSPSGVSDIYGNDCALKSGVSQKIMQEFDSFGYSEIQTPTFEYVDVFGDDMSIPFNEVIKFIDSDGRVLALRPDITTSISRAVASHMHDSPLPLRLCYVGNVYRSGESYKSAKKREFTQAGVELIGANTPSADAEVITLTIEALLKCGLRDFQIELSHSDFLQGIIDSCHLCDGDEEALKSLLDKKFSIGVEEFCEVHGLSDKLSDILCVLPSLFGDGEQVLNACKAFELNSLSQKALDDLNQVYSILKDFGLEKYITVDLGQVRSFKYYTGVIFRGLTTNSAFPICGGGRYDTLGRRFDLDLPATGVAIWVDRLSDALVRSSLVTSPDSPCDAVIFYSPSMRIEAFKKATQLRNDGKSVILDVLSLSKDAAIESANLRKIENVIFVEEGE